MDFTDMFKITDPSNTSCSFCGNHAYRTIGADDVASIHVCQSCMLRMRKAFANLQAESWLTRRICDPFHVGIKSILRDEYPRHIIEPLLMTTTKFTEMLEQNNT